MDAIGVKDYDVGMLRIISRAMLILAMLLMPLGMGTAAATSVHNHIAVSPMEHCPDQQSRHHANGGFGECAMACAAALPARDQVLDAHVAAKALANSPPPVTRLSGLHPEASTPPPRIA